MHPSVAALNWLKTFGDYRQFLTSSDCQARRFGLLWKTKKLVMHDRSLSGRASFEVSA